MVMKLEGSPVYPVLPAHALRFHLSRHRVARFGVRVVPLCGEQLVFGIGARRIHSTEWSSMHESLRCQRCVKAFDSRGGTA